MTKRVARHQVTVGMIGIVGVARLDVGTDEVERLVGRLGVQRDSGNERIDPRQLACGHAGRIVLAFGRLGQGPPQVGQHRRSLAMAARLDEGGALLDRLADRTGSERDLLGGRRRGSAPLGAGVALAARRRKTHRDRVREHRQRDDNRPA